METNTKMEILLSTGMTEYDAKRHLKNGAVIYDVQDYLDHFDVYAGDLDEDDQTELKKFLKKGEEGTLWDNDLVIYEGKKYFIEYVL